MKRFIVLFLLVYSTLYAEIDEYKVDLYFANGIMMQDTEAQAQKKWEKRVCSLPNSF